MRREVRVTATTTEGEVLDEVTLGWDDERCQEMGFVDGPITALRVIPTCPSREIIATHPAECDLVIGI